MPDRLEVLHRRIEDLTDPDGDFAVICPHSGKRPVPVRGASFSSPDAAEAAVELVTEYRELLREVDPHLENIPIVVAETTPDPLSFDEAADEDGSGARTVTLSGDADGEWLRMTDAPVVTVRKDGALLDDRLVSRQLRAQLRGRHR